VYGQYFEIEIAGQISIIVGLEDDDIKYRATRT
jgi:hypothetical protein